MRCGEVLLTTPAWHSGTVRAGLMRCPMLSTIPPHTSVPPVNCFGPTVRPLMMFPFSWPKYTPAERKPLPKEPEVGDQLGGGGSLAAQNEAAQQVFNNEALEACENCGRTFLKDRLKVHQKSCTQSSPAARVGASRLSTSSGTSPELGQTTTTTTAVPRPRVS